MWTRALVCVVSVLSVDSRCLLLTSQLPHQKLIPDNGVEPVMLWCPLTYPAEIMHETGTVSEVCKSMGPASEAC